MSLYHFRYQKKERALGKCLQSIYWQAFVKSHATREEAKKVLFIISAGESPDMTSSSASYVKKLKSKRVKIYGLRYYFASSSMLSST